MKKVPNFLGIGAEKAATSWLNQQLKTHPDIWLYPYKEVHYFDRSENYIRPTYLAISSPVERYLKFFSFNSSLHSKWFVKLIIKLLKFRFKEASWFWRMLFGTYNDQWYCRIFPNDDAYLIEGEITPGYAWLNDEDIQRIKTINPEVKIIYMIRNPIDRAWSALRFYSKLRKNTIPNLQVPDLNDTNQVIDFFENSPLNQLNEYEVTIINYLKYFKQEQFLIGFYDSVKHDPTNLLNSVTNFLETPQGENYNTQKKFNVSMTKQLPVDVKNFLTEKYTPLITNLAENLGSYAKVWLAEIEGKNFDIEIELAAGNLPPTVHPPSIYCEQ